MYRQLGKTLLKLKYFIDKAFPDSLIIIKYKRGKAIKKFRDKRKIR